MSLLRIRGLTISYAGNKQNVVNDLSFDVEAAESVGIVGESGAGKSQTALAIMGLLPANARIQGSIQIAGTEMVGATAQTLRKLRARKVSMIFQDPATALNPYLKIGVQLRRILLEHRLVSRQASRGKCIEMLERVGLPEPQQQYHAFVHQLSGGMRQRALIAAALIGEPQLIIADEPTTALDVTVQAQILQLLEELRHDSNTALLLITHDLGVINQSCNRLLVMDKGGLIEQGECREVLAHPVQPYTVRIIGAVSRIDAPGPPLRSAAPDKVPALEVSKLCVSYRDQWRDSGAYSETEAVQSVDLFVDAGESLAIVGESGSGKTSLARSVAGLVPASSGTVSLYGESLPWPVEARSPGLRRQLQMVFQDPQSSLNPAMRVGRIIAEPLAVHARQKTAMEVQQTVKRMMERVGLSQELMARYPHELSGGQAQRVAIARALVTEPAVLICDEAFSALDGTVRRDIIALLQAEQARSQLSLIMITHDLGVVREVCDRVIVMYKGRVCETANNEDLFSNPQHPYTKALLAAVPGLPR